MRQASLLLLALGMLQAQQPNGPLASMTWNLVDGPPWPITGVPLTASAGNRVDFGGPAQSPLALAAATSLTQPAVPVPGGGLLDLDPATLLVVWDWFANPAFLLDATGSLSLTLPAPTLPVAPTLPLQAAVFNAASASGVVLTAATTLDLGLDVTIIDHLLPNDGSVQVNLQPYGLELPFYGVSYAQYFVNSNGFITFLAPSNDFTPSDVELTTLMPRIAVFWTDLDPTTSPGGTIRSTIDATGLVGEVRVDFDQIRTPGMIQTIHTFAWSHRSSPDGTITLRYPPAQQPGLQPVVAGISAGMLGNPAVLQTDFSLVQDAGGAAFGPGVAIFEWFGFQGQVFYPLATNSYDLVNRVFFFTSNPTAAIPGAAGYGLL